MFPRQAIYRLLLRQGLINFARVGTAVPGLPSMFQNLSQPHGSVVQAHLVPWLHTVTVWLKVRDTVFKSPCECG